MFPSRRLEILFTYAVFAVLALTLAFQIGAQRALFADGSYQLLNLLEVENARATGAVAPGLFGELVTVNNEPMRFFTYVFTEIPVIAAMRAGMTHLPVLIFIFSSWMLFAPLLFWGRALWVLREDELFWPFVLMFSFVYFGGNFFAIGEYNFAFGLTACCLASLLQRRAMKPAGYIVLMLTGVLSIMSYASTLFMGVLLGALAFRKWKAEPSPGLRRYWIALIGVFAVSVAVGLWNYFYPAIPGNAKSARDVSILTQNMQFWFVPAYAALAWLLRNARPKEWRYVLLAVLAGMAAIFLFGDIHATPYVGYCSRAFTAVVFFGFAVLLSWSRLYKPQPARKNFDPLVQNVAPAFLIFAVLCFCDIRSSVAFGKYLDGYAAEVNAHTGVLRFEDSIALIPATGIYGWDWTYPSLSMLLKKNADGATVSNPDFQQEQGKWEPFNPYVSIPDLRRYYK